MSESLEARVAEANAHAAEIEEQAHEVMNILNDLAKQMQEQKMQPMALLLGSIRVASVTAVVGGMAYDDLISLMNESYAQASAIVAKQRQEQ